MFGFIGKLLKPNTPEESASPAVDSVSNSASNSISDAVPESKTHADAESDNNFISDPAPSQTNPEKPGFFARLKAGLAKTRAQFTEQISHVIFGKKVIDEAVLENLETQLLLADVGIDATKTLIDALTKRLKRNELADGAALYAALESQLIELLQPSTPFKSNQSIHSKPLVILMVGVNGSGKTTSIGKLAHYFQEQNHSVLLAAGDTFRAAAIEQLQTWGQRHQAAVIAQRPGSDSASVIFDALQAATARGVDVLLADTAGRLHTQKNLMEELKKIKRVLQKQNPDAPHETLLVIDASNGQNALHQAEQFHAAIGVTGIILTKLDGTAKGGIVFAITEKLKLPIRFIGIGEAADDLKPFDPADFVKALLALDMKS